MRRVWWPRCNNSLCSRSEHMSCAINSGVTSTSRMTQKAAVFTTACSYTARHTAKVSAQAKSTIGYLGNSCASCTFVVVFQFAVCTHAKKSLCSVHGAVKYRILRRNTGSIVLSVGTRILWVSTSTPCAIAVAGGCDISI